MNYYAVNVKLTRRYDKQTKQRPVEYQTLLIADKMITEAIIKNAANRIFGGMWVDKVICINEISEQEFNRRANPQTKEIEVGL